ncbi:MAG: hypothetical protein K1Y36_05455 [Blastocatellia bacterium]|nr:hypothetical protein [Blastocatellia bacterium]
MFDSLLRWILDDEQKDLYEFLIATLVAILFLGLAAVFLWPFGKAGFTWSLAKGYVIFWGISAIVVFIVSVLQRRLRVNMYDRFNLFLGSNLLFGGLLQFGWSAFAVQRLHVHLGGTSGLGQVALYTVGLLSCYVAFMVVSLSYEGWVYRFVNLALAMASYVALCVWPKAAQTVMGWLGFAT